MLHGGHGRRCGEMRDTIGTARGLLATHDGLDVEVTHEGDGVAEALVRDRVRALDEAVEDVGGADALRAGEADTGDDDARLVHSSGSSWDFAARLRHAGRRRLPQ